jgi:2-(1,2-epoxy-1,2-dihydrophenyl)acetyl-CoA isomerase
MKPGTFSMPYSKIICETCGAVAIIRLNDEKTLNAASPEMAEELRDALDKVGTSSRALILTGTGRGFCSGANLGGLKVSAPGYDAGAVLETHYSPLMLQLRALPIPFITAVNGPAAGLGCTLALAGDLVVAAESSYFLQAFRRIGLVPDGGSAFLLTRGAGRARAMEMMLLGDKIAATKALEWGLINRVVPATELDDTALALADELAAGPTKALSAIRKMCWDALESGFAPQLDRERVLQRELGRTADFREGVAAFLEKRPARFNGC